MSLFVQSLINTTGKHVVQVVGVKIKHLLKADNSDNHQGNNDHQTCGRRADDERQLVLH